MTIVLAHPSQSTLLTRRAGPAAARRPSPPYWLAWQRDPQLEVADLRSFYNRERSRAETIKRTVASRRKAHLSTRQKSPEPAPSVEQPQPEPEPEPAPAPTLEPTPTPMSAVTPAPTQGRGQPDKQMDLLGMYSSLLESRLQSVERVSKLISDWRDHKPLPAAPFPPSRWP